jgi:hypothetical protein
VAYVPPPAAPKKSSAWVVIALALVLVLGGGAAAAIVGVKMYNNWKNAKSLVATTDTTTTATSSAAVVPQTSSASTQPDPRLLFQPQQVPTKTDAAQVPVSDSSAAPVGGQASSPVNVPPVAQPTHVAQNNPHPSGSSAVVTRPADQPRPARRASGVAIAVMGDANLVSSVSQVVNSELSAAGLKTVETESLPATEGVTSTSRLISRLRDAGYAVLVVARVDAAGERQLKYLGRYDTAYTSKVTLTTYDLATGNPFGSPARGTIEYTTANADRKAEEVVGRLARDTAEAIQNH